MYYIYSVYPKCKYLVSVHTLNNALISALINKRGKHSVKTFVTIKHHHESVCLCNKLKLPLVCVCVL